MVLFSPHYLRGGKQQFLWGKLVFLDPKVQENSNSGPDVGDSSIILT